MNKSAEQNQEFEDMLARSQTIGELLSDPVFWKNLFFVFSDPEKVREFSEITGVPQHHMQSYIRKKRCEFFEDYIRQHSTYWHEEHGTLM
jgi:hypothetical protein